MIDRSVLDEKFATALDTSEADALASDKVNLSRAEWQDSAKEAVDHQG